MMDIDGDELTVLMIVNFLYNCGCLFKKFDKDFGTDVSIIGSNMAGYIFTVKPSTINRDMQGLFACSTLKAGTSIGIYEGYVVGEADTKKISQYAFGLPDGGTCDPLYGIKDPTQADVRKSAIFYNNLVLYINEPKYGSKSNCFASETPEGQVEIIACSKIQKGDELFLHYGDFYNRKNYTPGDKCYLL